MNQNLNYQNFYKEAMENSQQTSNEIHYNNNYANTSYNNPVHEQHHMQKENKDIFQPYDAFIRGNLFPHLYQPYKVAKPFEIKPMNEQADMLIYLDSLSFAAHELNLYLDIYPNDKEMIQKFENLRNESSKIRKEYEKKYGPLFVNSKANNAYPWAWNNSPWPWENS